MDLNVKIIEGVKEFPTLHDNCGDLDERNHAWLQLAEKLDMHVQILQIRWHALLQLYHRDANFKYSKRMQFISRNEQKQIKTDNWPEFVITEEYLKGYNSEDQEQFIYLDAEEENDSQSLKPSKENDCNHAEAAQEKNVKNSEDNSATDKVTREVKPSSEQNQPKINEVKINLPRKSKELDVSCNTNLKKKEEPAVVDLNKNNNTSFEEPKEKSSEMTPVVEMTSVERCEDVIFGELVSAMLKRMNEDKKKTIKKEIMNILFS